MTDPTPINGYCTVADLRREIFSPDDSQVPNGVDDQVLCDIITDASRTCVDNGTRRQFYATSDTLYLNAPVPYERMLWFGQDVLAVQGASDGNGNVIPSSEYYLWPRNTHTYAAIVMNQNSQYGWFAGSNGNTEGAITIAASIGYCDRSASSASAPQEFLNAIAASRRATLIYAADMYRKRFPNSSSKAASAASDADKILESYVRILY